MRLLERVLLVVGASTLGMATGGPCLAYLGGATLFRSRPGAEPGHDWGSAVGSLACGLCGGGVGAAAGFAGAFRWIARDGGRPWYAATWIGVAVGLAAAATVRVSGLTAGHPLGGLIRWWPGTAIFLTAAGTLGGLIGSIAGAVWARRGAGSSGRPAKRSPRRGPKRKCSSEEPDGK